MGTRINYEVAAHGNNGGAVAAILYSNSSHSTEIPEQHFRHLVQLHPGSPSDFVAALLELRYKTADGNHHVGDRMFWIDIVPGDREMVLRVVFESAGPAVVKDVTAAGRGRKAAPRRPKASAQPLQLVTPAIAWF